MKRPWAGTAKAIYSKAPSHNKQTDRQTDTALLKTAQVGRGFVIFPFLELKTYKKDRGGWFFVQVEKHYKMLWNSLFFH